jgi:hypothetical protein
MNVETEAFHHLIVHLNKAHYKYNRGDFVAASGILWQIRADIETLKHHIDSQVKQSPETSK